MKKAVVILSHSSYSDIWEMMMLSYNKYFSEKESFDFFISTDKVTYELEKLVTNNNFNLIIYDKNITWGKSLKQTIGYLLDNKYSYTLFSFDDLILTSEIKKSINGYIDLMSKNDIKYLKLKNGFWFKQFKYKLFYEISDRDSYKGSLVFALLNQGLMKSIKEIDEVDYYNPWEYEMNIYKYFKGVKFYCVSKSLISFSNTIIKGKLDRIQLFYSKLMINYCYNGPREKMNMFSTIKFQIKVILFVLFKNILPNHIFSFVRKLKKKIR